MHKNKLLINLLKGQRHTRDVNSEINVAGFRLILNIRLR